jgi:hypothetical protein
MTTKSSLPTPKHPRQERYAARLRAQGYQLRSFWISPEAIDALDALSGSEPSYHAVNRALIEAARIKSAAR